jgi:hypothetical protein
VEAGDRDLGRCRQIEPVLRNLVDVLLVGRERAVPISASSRTSTGGRIVTKPLASSRSSA